MSVITNFLSRLPLIGRFVRPPGPDPQRTLEQDRLQLTAPRRNPTSRFEGFAGLPPATGPHKLGSGETLVVTNPQARPPKGAPLSVMSFNIYKGGAMGEPFWAYFADQDKAGKLPDVIALQETNQEVSMALAKQYGYHVAYYGRDAGEGGRLVNGKAILSRYPIGEAAHYTYDIPDAVRQQAIAHRGKAGELNEDRGLLRTTVEVAGQQIDLFDVHHTLGDSVINAKQVYQLHAMVERSKAEGRAAIIAGDFNVNFPVAEGGRIDARGTVASPTDTPEEFEDRHGQADSLATESWVQAAIRQLVKGNQSFWDAEQRRVAVGDRVLSPEAALRELSKGGLDRGSADYKKLLNVLDGNTLAGAPKRFDTILATPGLKLRSGFIDQSVKASDHQPIIAEFDL